MLVAAIFVCLGSAADAATKKKKKKSVYSSERSQSRSKDTTYGQTEFSRPEDLPTGSALWWRAMEREGRGGFSPDS